MIPIRSILVPTDFSPSSGAAWRYAQALAGRFKSRLHLLHVLTAPPFFSDPLGAEGLVLQVADLLKTSEAAARKALIDISTTRVLARRVVRATRVGVPVDEILKYVKANHVDLVVMGTHGRGPVGHVLLGSVAERVVRRSPVPVMTVHASPQRSRRRPGPRRRT